MKWPLHLGALALPALLSACATLTPATPHARHPIVLPAPRVELPKMPAVISTLSTSEAASADLWDRLRSSFAMADCDADPEVLAQARRYTHNPRIFESQLIAVLPRIAYVQGVAERHHVAGEFVLLPWVESHFRPVRARHRRPAGMWQIMPVTAGSMGLTINPHYDGRLDLPAAADAVMTMLSKLDDQFHDWRVADIAYNSGEFAARAMVQKYGMPPQEPVLPTWPIPRGTREHLTKLLAMACIVREPQRFSVELPRLAEDRHLVKVRILRSMPMTRAAHHAGMSVDTLAELNAAFGNGIIDARNSPYLMLPASQAGQFRSALQQQSVTDRAEASEEIASVKVATHKVKPGENLWSIARAYSVKVGQLKLWNHLESALLKPGVILRVGSQH